MFVACVEWRFWSGAQTNQAGRGQRNWEEIGSRVLLWLRPLSSASDITAMLRRLKYLASMLHSFFLKFGLTLGEIDLL